MSTLPTKNAIVYMTNKIQGILLDKNRKYGDSALSPARIFSQASTKEQLLVRIDDKLSRIKTLDPEDQEDTVLDLVGYLVLLMIANENEKECPFGIDIRFNASTSGFDA